MNKEQRKFYNKGYQKGFRKATLVYLGNECNFKGCTRKPLEIHHIDGIEKKNRNQSDYAKILRGEEKAIILCKYHHERTDNFRRKF